jgi:hypothetical protein
MNDVFVLTEPLEDVWKDQVLPYELNTYYTMRTRGVWTWLERHGKYLVVDLLAAADFFEETRRPWFAARLRDRAELRLMEHQQQAALAARLREAVGR